MRKLILFLCVLAFSTSVFGQTVDLEYINPKLGSGSPYSFLRFGTSLDYKAGFMWNNTSVDYGDGNDFSIFTYNNRDITLRTGTGNIIMFPTSGGNVGIGTTSPNAKLHVNGTIKGSLGHSNGYFTMYPFSYSYDDGSYVKSFYDGNNKQIKFWNSDPNTDYTRLQTGGLTVSSRNPNSSVHGFANKIELTGQSNGAIVFKPGDNKELMFGMHDNGNFYWGTGQSATKPNFYSMILDGSTGDLTVYNWIRPKGSAGIFFQDHGGGFNMSDDTWIRTYGNKNFYHNTGIMRTDGQLQVGPSGNRLIVNTSGNIGIGTTTPDAKLAVNGNIHTKEVKVDLIGWADYVFKEDYNLPTLKQVEDHIATKGHLINIPSAAEVSENGIQLGEMNAKLLEKIEELTLYTIAQEKRIKSLEEKIEKIIDNK